jgi:signal transduction histidine kinase
VKHAHAAHAIIHLKKSDDILELLIKDDGQGITLGSEPEAHSFGLGSMRERSRLSGGRFTIESDQDTGTTIRASWETKDNGNVTD